MSASASDPSGGASGAAWAPGSSRRYAAWLVWQQGSVWIMDADRQVLTAAPVTRIEQMPGTPPQVHLANGWRFEASPDADLSGLPGARPDGWLGRAETWHPRLLAVIAACLLGVWVIWRWGLDLLVALALALTPGSVVSTIDSSNMAVIDRLMAEETALSPSRQADIQVIFDDLTDHAPPAPWGDYRLLFRDLPGMGPNAFALPGGTVVVTDELLTRFENPDVVAGVLGHEIAHVSQRHSLRQLYRAGSIWLLVTLIIGDPGPFLEEVVGEGNALLSLSYSRAHEAEADRIGIETARAAGYDPAALAIFFDRLRQDRGAGDGPGWLSTHPAHEARIRAIRAQAAP